MEHDVDTDMIVMFVLGIDTDFNSMVRLALGTDGLGYQNAYLRTDPYNWLVWLVLLILIVFLVVQGHFQFITKLSKN